MRTCLIALMALVVTFLPSPGRSWQLETFFVGPELRLVDGWVQTPDGARKRFVTDIMSGRPALVSFTFLGCRSQCPASDVYLNTLAIKLGERSRHDLRLVTLTLDPLGDQPEHLAKAQSDGWFHASRTLLTGAWDDVDAILQGFGMRAGADERHLTKYFVIDSGGRIARSLTQSDADSLLDAVSDVR